MPGFDLYKALSQAGDIFRQLSVLNPLTIHKKGGRTKALFALGLVCFFWGTTWIASREGVKHMPALQMAGIRQTIGGLCYVLFFLLKKAPLPRRKEWLTILILSFLNFTLTNGLTTWGVQYISAGLGSIMSASFPLWIVVIGLFTSANKIPSKAMAGLILGFAGVCVIFYDHLHDFLNEGFRFGIIISLIGTWTWSFGTIYTKKYAAGFNPYFSLGLQMLISGAFLSILVQLAPSSIIPTIPFNIIPWQSWSAIAYLVIFGSLISFIAFMYALKNLPTEESSLYAYINPIVALIFGSMFFDEKISMLIVVGALITLAGVYLVNRSFRSIAAKEQI